MTRHPEGVQMTRHPEGVQMTYYPRVMHMRYNKHKNSLLYYEQNLWRQYAETKLQVIGYMRNVKDT